MCMRLLTTLLAALVLMAGVLRVARPDLADRLVLSSNGTEIVFGA